MPTVNVYCANKIPMDAMERHATRLKGYFSKTLSGKSINLSPEEISVRFIEAKGNGMIADVELEIKAHAFPERVAM